MLAPMSVVADLMTRDILTADPADSIGEAAQKMTERGVGSIVVSDYGRMIGILTERDVLKAVAGRVHSSEARVREWMTSDPVTVAPSTPVEEAGRIMLEAGFRHLPVVEEDRPVGIVSIRDLAAWGISNA
jgi:CBS domain-containing protein